MAASEKEIRRRLDAITSKMRDEGLDALILFSQAQMMYAGVARCVSNYHLTTGRSTSCFHYPEILILIVPTLGQQFFARRHSWIKEVRCGGEGSGMIREVAKVLRTQKLETGAIGIIGFSNTLPLQDHQILTQELPGARFSDGTDLFDKVRMVKSEEEIAMIQETADMADACYERLLEVLRIGVNGAMPWQRLCMCWPNGG